MTQLAANQIRPATPLTAEDLAGYLIQPGHPLFGIVWVNPERLSGAPCFAGTRVPVKALFDYLEGGEPLEEFLEGFPPVTREQAVAALELSRSSRRSKIMYRYFPAFFLFFVGGLVLSCAQHGSTAQVAHNISSPDALINAVIGRQPEAVRGLVARGANVNAVDSSGNTPLYYAASSRRQRQCPS